MWWNWFLHQDTVVVESYSDSHADFYGFDLRTGKRKARHSAITDTEISKSSTTSFSRNAHVWAWLWSRTRQETADTRGCLQNSCWG